VPATAPLSNAEIADRLSALAQLLTVKGDNPYKIRAYRRAATTIRGLGESVDELVRNEGDLTAYEGIGKAIADSLVEHLKALKVDPANGGLLQINGSPTDAAAGLIKKGIHEGLDNSGYPIDDKDMPF